MIGDERGLEERDEIGRKSRRAAGARAMAGRAGWGRNACLGALRTNTHARTHTHVQAGREGGWQPVLRGTAWGCTRVRILKPSLSPSLTVSHRLFLSRLSPSLVSAPTRGTQHVGPETTQAYGRTAP